MRVRTIVVACAICLLIHPCWSIAQDRIHVSIDGAQQTNTTNFKATTTFTELVELGRLTTSHKVAKAPVYGVGVNVRAWKNLVVGVAVSDYSKATSGEVDAEVPHPFFFDRLRPVSGTAPNLKRMEIGSHIGIGWLIRGNRLDLTVSAGPSIFQVKQDLVSRVAYTQTYPYDAAQFAGVSTQRLSDRAIGFHAGADVTWRLIRHLGVGGTLRYTRGTLDTTVGSDAVKFTVGGLHAGGGLRVIF